MPYILGINSKLRRNVKVGVPYGEEGVVGNGLMVLLGKIVLGCNGCFQEEKAALTTKKRLSTSLD